MKLQPVGTTTTSLVCRGMMALLIGLAPWRSAGAESTAIKPGAENLSARQTVDTTVSKVKEVVKTKKDSLSPEELDQELRDLITPVFDFREMSRRSLGANWRKASPKQQTEFVDLFSDLLARNYLKKIRTNAETSEVAIVGEKTKGERALVQTVISYDGQKATVDYRLRKKKDGWKVYDVIVENIGLVTNYRSEFAKIVKSSKIEGLLKKLRAKEI